jgi:FkbM family methyltransferase
MSSAAEESNLGMENANANGADPARFTLRHTILFYAKWIVYSGKNMFLKRGRFLVVTPPRVKKTIVWNKRSKAFFSLEIRDVLEWITLSQIYIVEDYDIEKLARYADMERYYQGLVQDGRTPLIIDCGANIGLSAKYFSQVYPEAKIVAVEPDEGNVVQMRKHCDPERVTIRQAAVASSEMKGKLVDPGLGNSGYRVTEDQEGSLQMLSIPSILEEARQAGVSPFLIKIDIEGAESELFSRNVDWINEFPLVIIELHDWLLPGKATSQSFLREISRLDRDFVFSGENVFSISNDSRFAQVRPTSVSA